MRLLGVQLWASSCQAALLAERSRRARPRCASARCSRWRGRSKWTLPRSSRRAALPRASSSSQSSATAGCSGRSARQAAARPHCDVTLEARAAPALPLPDAEQLVAPLFRLLAELRVPTEDYAADDVTYYDA